MYVLYNLLVLSASAVLRIVALFNSKIALFVNGRKETFSILLNSIAEEDRVIWIHAASLGEYEQGLPVIEKLKQYYPLHKIVLTFFSPSGFEVKKNSDAADVICYLPLDTKKNVEVFLKAVHPEMALFIKYEIWPNYLYALHKKNIPTLLLSALFNDDQIYFKWYGLFMRKALSKFSHFFVQNERSSELLNTIGFQNVTIAGDTRFDRVSEIVARDNSLDFMLLFKQDKFCFVAGSTWPEDEKILIECINQNVLPVQFVIAPHTIKPKQIEILKKAINKPVICYSELNTTQIKNFEVLIIDTIGLLTKIYSYADAAYVGGGFSTGLHNTLEPAVFGIPVLIGPNYEGFAEAERLIKLGGILTIKNNEEFQTQVNNIFEDGGFRGNIGQINHKFIQEQKGATQKIMSKIKSVFE